MTVSLIRLLMVIGWACIGAVLIRAKNVTPTWDRIAFRLATTALISFVIAMMLRLLR